MWWNTSCVCRERSERRLYTAAIHVAGSELMTLCWCCFSKHGPPGYLSLSLSLSFNWPSKIVWRTNQDFSILGCREIIFSCKVNRTCDDYESKCDVLCVDGIGVEQAKPRWPTCRGHWGTTHHDSAQYPHIYMSVCARMCICLIYTCLPVCWYMCM